MLFVFYGLLKQGAEGAPSHIPFDTAGEFLGPCCFQADMFDAGGYPGVREGEGICHAVLYRLDDPTILPDMDAFEDCDMADPEGSMYQRRRIAYFDGPQGFEDGTAWIYWYAFKHSHFPSLETGIWPLSD